MKNLVILAAIALAVDRMLITPRLAVPTWEGSFEALSHLFVGFLLLIPFYDREETLGPSKLYGWIGLALSLWELGWFIAQKSAI
jgi:hypothetical protein